MGAGHGSAWKARILPILPSCPMISGPLHSPDLAILNPREHSLWVLTKDGRTAEARTRMVPGGPELRIYINGSFLRAEGASKRNFSTER